MFSFLWGMYSADVTGSSVCLTLWATAKLHSKRALPSYIPTNNALEFQTLQIPTDTRYYHPWTCTILAGVQGFSHRGFNANFLTKWVSFAVFMGHSYLLWCSLSSNLSLSLKMFVLLLLNYKSSLHILDYTSFVRCMYCEYLFSQEFYRGKGRGTFLNL